MLARQARLFEENILEGKADRHQYRPQDTDNLLPKTTSAATTERHFLSQRNEGMAGHRNRGGRQCDRKQRRDKRGGCIRVRGETTTWFSKTTHPRYAPRSEGKQTIGIQLEKRWGAVTLEGNQVEAVKATTTSAHEPVKRAPGSHYFTEGNEGTEEIWPVLTRASQLEAGENSPRIPQITQIRGLHVIGSSLWKSANLGHHRAGSFDRLLS